MYRIACIGFSLSPILMGLFLLSNTLLDASASLDAELWPTTQGTIIDMREPGLINYSGRQGGNIAYRYQVQGVEYIGYRAGFGGGVSALNKASGERVTVRYNPINHRESTLLTGLRINHLLQGLFGVLLIWLGQHLWKRLRH